ncbi:MAG: hypothetical protein H6908_01980 [Hyphomicrobiales bacterium]|nr:hypothetical protein [Hyphomicrobiales bacterium]
MSKAAIIPTIDVPEALAELLAASTNLLVNGKTPIAQELPHLGEKIANPDMSIIAQDIGSEGTKVFQR